MQHILSIEALQTEFIHLLFERAEQLRRMRGLLPAQAKSFENIYVALLFFEPSTRTRVSFEIAAKRLGAYIINFNPHESSLAKGESLRDTVSTLFAIGCRYFVIRHDQDGSLQDLTDLMGTVGHVINAGDGAREHPTQALLDAYTIAERKNISGLKVAIVGDIKRSRVAYSNMHLLTRLGAQCYLAGPPVLMPEKINVPGVVLCASVDDAVADADVVMMLRVQDERVGGNAALDKEHYLQNYGLTQDRLGQARPDAFIMHPGPVRRNYEIASSLVEGPQSLISRQVENGVFVRMALLAMLQDHL